VVTADVTLYRRAAARHELSRTATAAELARGRRERWFRSAGGKPGELTGAEVLDARHLHELAVVLDPVRGDVAEGGVDGIQIAAGDREVVRARRGGGEAVSVERGQAAVSVAAQTFRRAAARTPRLASRPLRSSRSVLFAGAR
jgi:hypothetical protein